MNSHCVKKILNKFWVQRFAASNRTDLAKIPIASEVLRYISKLIIYQQQDTAYLIDVASFTKDVQTAAFFDAVALNTWNPRRTPEAPSAHYR